MAVSLTNNVANAQADALARKVDNGYLRIYSGTRPATSATALSGNTILAELTCGSPFAPAASGGVLTANAITQDSSANATGTATFYRLFRSDGTTVCWDGDVGTSGADLNLASTSLVATQPVQVTSYTISPSATNA